MDNLEFLLSAYKTLRDNGIVHTQKELAEKIGVGTSQLSKAMKGSKGDLSEPLIKKVQLLLDESCTTSESIQVFTVPLLPIEAIGGRLGDYSNGVTEFECEKIVSPVKGATHAIRVHGDSMAPEYPNGSMILIKQVNEKAFIEWGRVYVLDTENGVVIKEVHKNETDETITCVSLNPDKKYSPFQINTSYIYGWYRVLMVMSIK